MRAIKTAGKRGLRKLFEIGQRFGLNILPTHFYSEIPSVRALRASKTWRRPMDMVGVGGADVDEQVGHFAWLFEQAGDLDWQDLGVYRTAVAANGEGGGYGAIEAEVLFAFIIAHRPRRVVQVGCGVSTSVILQAAGHCGHPIDVTCIEPYPSRYLADLDAAGRIRLIAEPAETVDHDVFATLDRGDLLFIDSTHCVRPGSEVNRLILDVLPRAQSEIFVHFHDIYFPYDYQRRLLSDELFFHNESSLLHAFLVNNNHFRILFSLSQIHYDAGEAIHRYLPHYRPQSSSDGLAATHEGHFPSATYLVAA